MLSSISMSQSTAVLAPTPRGSKPTRSNVRRSRRARRRAADERNSIPDPPGPPGLNTSEPIRSSGSAAGTRASAMSIVAPSGSSWSSGTSSVAHSSSTPMSAARRRTRPSRASRRRAQRPTVLRCPSVRCPSVPVSSVASSASVSIWFASTDDTPDDVEHPATHRHQARPTPSPAPPRSKLAARRDATARSRPHRRGAVCDERTVRRRSVRSSQSGSTVVGGGVGEPWVEPWYRMPRHAHSPSSSRCRRSRFSRIGSMSVALTAACTGRRDAGQRLERRGGDLGDQRRGPSMLDAGPVAEDVDVTHRPGPRVAHARARR